jgi:DNA-binding cell septation regulator SpoVG
MTMDTVKVIEIRKTRKPGPLRAFVDVKIGTWIINDWRVWQQNGRAYVSPPQASWKDTTGQIKFKPILTIPDEELQQIQTAILYGYHQEAEKTNEPSKR